MPNLKVIDNYYAAVRAFGKAADGDSNDVEHDAAVTMRDAGLDLVKVLLEAQPFIQAATGKVAISLAIRYKQRRLNSTTPITIFSKRPSRNRDTACSVRARP
jgi:hypothetical protein